MQTNSRNNTEVAVFWCDRQKSIRMSSCNLQKPDMIPVYTVVLVNLPAKIFKICWQSMTPLFWVCLFEG